MASDRQIERERRLERVGQMQAQGMTYAQIGHELGVGPERVRQLFCLYLQMQRERSASGPTSA